MTIPVEYYNNNLQTLRNKSFIISRFINWLAFTRLLIFLSIFFCIFYLIPNKLLIGIILTSITITTFLILIKIHLRKRGELKHIQALEMINSEEIKALNYEFDIYYPGNEFIDTSHAYSYDMDLFGNGSIYQFINRTVTSHGRNLLAEMLIKETLDTEIILEKQVAVKELAQMPDLLQDFRAAGNISTDNEQDVQIIGRWIDEPAYYLSRKGILWLAKILPFITLVSIILAFFIPLFRGLFIALFISQLLIIGKQLRYNSAEHNKLGKRLEALRKYQQLIDYIEKGRYTGKELTMINEILNKGKISAASSIKSLVKILSAFDNRLNILVAIFLEGLLLWDLQCMIRLEQWKNTKGNNFEIWIDALARFDVLVSLANFAFNHPHLTYPLISNQIILDATKLGHILIPQYERVCNDFTIEKQGDFTIITGANMAGKSTFLRTVAINIILAMAGAPVCAESFSFRPIRVFSSMRTSDSLNKHESYFYAELRRLKEMLDRLRAGEKLFIILDEILKGTNSADKQKGSFEVMEQIIELKGTGLLATHDLNLATIEQKYPEKIKNMCFEVEIDHANISFDYILCKGVTTKMNAFLLMQQMGIIK